MKPDYAVIVIFCDPKGDLRSTNVKHCSVENALQLCQMLPVLLRGHGMAIPSEAKFRAFWSDDDAWVTPASGHVQPDREGAILIAVDEAAKEFFDLTTDNVSGIARMMEQEFYDETTRSRSGTSPSVSVSNITDSVIALSASGPASLSQVSTDASTVQDDSPSKDERPPQLVDPQGSPFPRRIRPRERWESLSRMTRLVIVSLTATVAAAAALLTNLQTIQDFFQSAPSRPGVPPIVVEISNSSGEPIDVATRGDFFLWLPGPDARRTFGKFELRGMDDAAIEPGMVTVPPAAKVRVLAQLANQDLYGAILERADCDVAFMVRKAGGGHRTTGNLPFTRDAIHRYYAEVDIGAE
jgi:hypothetical protein